MWDVDLKKWFASDLKKFRHQYYKTLLIFALAFVFLFAGSRSVFAETPTPTSTPIPPTPTWENLINPAATATPRNLSCPTQQPVGWKTLTPDPLWLMNCGVCVKVTPNPTLGGNLLATLNVTPTPYGNKTATPGGVTATANPTATATAGALRYYVVNAVGAHSWTNGSSKAIHWFEEGELDSVCFTDVNGVKDKYSAIYLAPAASNSIDYYAMINNNNTRTIWQWVVGGYTGAQQYWMIYEMGKPANYWEPYFGVVTFRNGRDVPSANRRFGAEVDPNKTQSYAGKTLCYGDGIDPASDSGKYCGTVVAADGGTGGIGINIPNILVSPATCYDVGGQSFGTGFMADWIAGMPESINIPGIRVCVRQLILPSINLFGLNISMASIALAMAGIWLFKSLVEEG